MSGNDTVLLPLAPALGGEFRAYGDARGEPRGVLVSPSGGGVWTSIGSMNIPVLISPKTVLGLGTVDGDGDAASRARVCRWGVRDKEAGAWNVDGPAIGPGNGGIAS